MAHARTPRIAARPNPRDWDPDDLLTLPEAVALFWPDGPLTVASLRTAIRDGRLAVTVIARKFFVTPSAVRAMSRPQTTAPSSDRAVEIPKHKNRNDDSWSETGL